jgi:hypothetical protein
VTVDTVWLLGYPVQLGISVAEHVEDWLREFKLMSIGAQSNPPTHPVPARLQQMVDHLSHTYARELSEPDRLRAAAAAHGEATVDLAYPTRPETEHVLQQWQDLLAEVDGYCRSQDLLTLQRSTEQVAFNDWLAQEFIRQIHGQPPQPWPSTSVSRTL